MMLLQVHVTVLVNGPILKTLQNHTQKTNLREVQLALGNQRVEQTVHNWHQNQDQNRVDSLVGREGMLASIAFRVITESVNNTISDLHLFRLDC